MPVLVAALLGVALLAGAAPGWAQEQEEQQKSRRVEALSERVHRQLSKAQDAIEAEDFIAAEALLGEILEMGRLRPYERATALRVLAFAHIERDDMPAAIDAFVSVIKVGTPDVIGEGLYYQTLKVLAQLYNQEENYKEAEKYALQWLSSVEDPLPKDYILLAMIYYQLDDMQRMQDYALRAIEKAKATGVEIEEGWWSLLNHSYMELEQYPEALEVTKILLTQWPKKSYWNLLSGLYSYQDDEFRQLAASWSAYDQGLLTSDGELRTVAQLLLREDFPYKAAVILQEGMDDGLVEKNARNYRLLAQAWQMSREDRKALDPLRRAAEIEEDAEDKANLYVRLAETYSALSDYGECAEASRQALRIRQLEKRGRTNMLLGQCLFEQEKYDEARDAFGDAADDPDMRRNATRWRNHVVNEVARLQALEDQLARSAN